MMDRWELEEKENMHNKLWSVTDQLIRAPLPCVCLSFLCNVSLTTIHKAWFQDLTCPVYKITAHPTTSEQTCRRYYSWHGSIDTVSAMEYFIWALTSSTRLGMTGTIKHPQITITSTSTAIRLLTDYTTWPFSPQCRNWQLKQCCKFTQDYLQETSALMPPVPVLHVRVKHI